MGNIIVRKYGGTSVGSVDRIKAVASGIVKKYLEGNKMVIVVSAMGDTTDHLLEMAHQINNNPSPRELDMLLSTGEQISIALLAIAIESLGQKAISLNATQVGIITDTIHKRAKIVEIKRNRIQRELDEGKIVIIAGFQGITSDLDITTLGRGGSDTSAVAIAAALDAKVCEIYTDVDGVYTADPRKVKGSQKLSKITYDEMLELANLGAKVLHPRSVELAKNYNIPLVVKSSFVEKEGTYIVGDDEMEKKHIVRGVTLDTDIAKIAVIEVPDRPGIAYTLFSELAKKEIKIDMIIQSIQKKGMNDISFTVKKEDLHEALAVCEEVRAKMNAKEVVHSEEVAKISVVGVGIFGNAGIASNFFEALYEKNINIRMISTSEIKLSCLIDKDQGDEALRSIHEKFVMGGLEIVSSTNGNGN
jgi:aspartate kinase